MFEGGLEMAQGTATQSLIVVLDFDCTITRTHTGGCALAPNQTVDEFVRGNVKPGFADFVRTAAAAEVPVYIATYGDDRFGEEDPELLAGHGLVRRYLDVVLGPDQPWFTFPKLDFFGEPEVPGNVIARFSNDAKQYHLDQVTAREGIDPERPSEMRRILLVDDDPANLRHFRERGCSILRPQSAEDSAALAEADNLFFRLKRALERRRDGAKASGSGEK